MKLICVHEADDADVTFYLRPDTALLRNNDSFYYPEFTEHITARVCVIFRVCRLGRSIGERFAARYYDAVGAGMTFTAADLLARHTAQGKPWGNAVAFDYSTAVSREFLPIAAWDGNLAAHVCGTPPQPIALDMQGTQRLPQIIARISAFMTLKIGDYIFIPASAPFPIQCGNLIETFFGDRKMMEVAVK
ncbi:MAG: 2-hydroxyhepta-2,4-diene-1,7-dioate isomerase [Prevotellaceae bacterium]|nr:2-hydroxyhepta-2,4-diene-1,7-dioate isomerase [Prevotellaceae bacterium]